MYLKSNKNSVAIAVALSLMLMSVNGRAATTPLAISPTPLYVTVNVAPNIVVTLDDSGSMASAYAPDSLSSDTATKRFKSASYNPLYYDPTVVYSPPKKYDGSSYPNSSYTSAPINGFDTSRGYVNLSTKYAATISYNPSSTSQSTTTTSGVTSTKGYYFTYNPTSTSCSPVATTNDACYVLSYISGTDTVAQTNFANWYSYYRTRNLSVASGATVAFSGLNTNVRVAWQSLSTCNTFGTTCAGWDGTKVDNRIRVFSDASTTSQKANFYKWVSRLPASNTTPLRTAMDNAGKYYKTTGVSSPYAYDPQTTDTPEYSCRKNYHVLMTDGVWNDTFTLASPTNADNSTTTLPQTVLGVSSYSPQAPYKDANSSSLADVAFYYWVHDLRTDAAMGNNVGQYLPVTTGTDTQNFYNAKNDPATWQHMVNFTVGLGLVDTLVATTTNAGWYGNTYASNSANTDGYVALVNGTKTWPGTGANYSPGNVYDLWHAAINSRGQFFGVDTPSSISTAFTSIVNTILASTPSAASLAANSTKLDTGTAIYQAKFSSTDWSGLLQSYKINSDGTVGVLNWEASTLLPAASSRNLYTINSSTGTGLAFATSSFAGLSTTQQANLNTTLAGATDTNGLNRINWLRGDQSKEVKNGGIFRNRSDLLGDIINSDPAFMQDTDFGYANLPSSAPERTSYTSFYNANLTRTPMLYTGANDGILHAFRADVGNAASGQEIFGFVPGQIYPNLSKLTDPNYTHTYYVDGAPTVGDAYVNGAWKTVLIGTLGGGGKSVFALDVTVPENFDSTKVIGEYTDTDLGYTYSVARIAKLHDGSWAAIFGNGYNSTAGKAYLFIVNLSTGAITKIATDATLSNGLSTPTLLDVDNDHVTDYVYAGDLQGRVWKFDLTSASSTAWGVSYSGAPLYTARNSSGQVQPITGPVAVGPNSASPAGGYIVYFGTGRYVATGDQNVMDTESLYGIWDNNAAITTTDRSQLQAQSILAEVTFGTNQVRATSANAVNWTTQKGWYMDLLQPPSATQQGERVVSQPLLRNGNVIFTTLIPSTDPCVPGGTGWLMELNAQTGARLDTSALDLNNDKQFDSSDFVTITIGGVATKVAVSGLKSTVGIIKTPAVVDTGTGVEYKFLSGTSGGVQGLTEKGATTPPPPSTTPTTPPPCTTGCTSTTGVPANSSRTSWKELQ